MFRVVHIVNPVKITEKSDLFSAQPITFESILRAKEFSRFKNQIQLVTTQYEEDIEIIPEGFTVLSNLSQSVLDVNPELKGKKLPLIKDILEKASDLADADFIIFTNMDIALMPGFYDAVFTYLEQGHDVVVINRRRISGHYSKIEELPMMYADMGKSHPGFDCFIFDKQLLSQLILDDICVGISFLETTLIHNLFSFAKNPLFVPDKHLTFHIGMDVLVPRSNAFYLHNRTTFFQKIYPKLKPYFDLRKFPYGTMPIYKRSIKWMLNPSLFTRNYLNLEGMNWLQKLKYRLDEIRWRIIQK